MTNYWIIGPHGQLGHQFAERLNTQCVGLERGVLGEDVSSVRRGLDKALKKSGPPKRLINCAAYNKVDLAESEKAACWSLNVLLPEEMAKWCAEHKVQLVHYSTDFVYSGEGIDPWAESDPCVPVNYYGQSKLAGEEAVRGRLPTALIFRTSWVYSFRRENFVLAIIKKARQGSEIKVVSDQVGHPTYADSLAEMTLQILSHKRSLAGGLFNLSNIGFVTRFDFAKEILRQASNFEPSLKLVELTPTLSSALKMPAIRPNNTRLSLEKVQKTFSPNGLDIAPWEKALHICIKRIYEKGE